MYDSIIDLLCDGDCPERDGIRATVQIAGAELLADAREKAAATNSDQFEEKPIQSQYIIFA